MRSNRKASIGVILLLCGFLIAAVYWHEKNEKDSLARQTGMQVEPTWQDSPLDFADSKKAVRSYEMTYGKIGVLVETWYYDWQGLGSFEKVEIVVATLLIATGIGFLISASRT
jgi:hypothetical protein